MQPWWGTITVLSVWSWLARRCGQLTRRAAHHSIMQLLMIRRAGGRGSNIVYLLLIGCYMSTLPRWLWTCALIGSGWRSYLIGNLITIWWFFLVLFKNKKTICYLQHCRIVEYLLQNNADPSSKDINGYTPTHYAAFNGHKTSLEMVMMSALH